MNAINNPVVRAAFVKAVKDEFSVSDDEAERALDVFGQHGAMIATSFSDAIRKVRKLNEQYGGDMSNLYTYAALVGMLAAAQQAADKIKLSMPGSAQDIADAFVVATRQEKGN